MDAFSEPASSFEDSIIDDDDFMQVTESATVTEDVHGAESDVDMPEVDSSSVIDTSEVAAIVCGVPVMISDCEIDTEKKVKEDDKITCESPSRKDSEGMDLNAIKEDKEIVVTPGKRSNGEKLYAVSLPNVLSVSEALIEEPLVFKSKIEALAAIKKHPGARFMEFTSFDDAIKYCISPLPVARPTLVEEKPSKYKTVTSQQMVSLRKAIEKGDESTFLETVWSNPRYLINNAGDGPTVMQEGTRYNALHVAARFKQSEMCLTVLNTLQDNQFISLLYPLETPETIEKRIERLVDLYLNTPDKSLSETPLHFASKFGADEMVSILLSYPQCDVNKKNKYGLLPKEMVCDRTSHKPEFKEKIVSMFEDSFYVPVLRDLTNNIHEPVIGKPCRTDTLLAATASQLTCGENNLVYCAFAGPMSESAADNFYTLLKKRKFSNQLSFTPEEKRQLLNICLSDSEKGLERVGRKLAKELNVGWIEYWSALQFWGDLSKEGLEFLERKLRSHFKTERSLSSNVAVLIGRCENVAKDMVDFADDFVEKLPEILNNKTRMSFFVLFQALLPHIRCMTEISFSKGQELYLLHKKIGHLLYLKLTLYQNQKEQFQELRFYLNKQFHIVDNLLKAHRSDDWKMLVCILKYTCYYSFSDVASMKPPRCDCNWKSIEEVCYSSYFTYKYIMKEIQSFMNKSIYRAPKPVKCSEKVNEIVVPLQNLSLTSPKNHSFESQSSDVEVGSDDRLEYHDCSVDMRNSDPENSMEEDDGGSEGFFTPPESPSFVEEVRQELFVNGVDTFSDVDIDIFRAIVDGGAEININKHPYVFEWKRLMESKLRSLLKPNDKLSCTPASSSASLRRAVMPVERVRRTLF